MNIWQTVNNSKPMGLVSSQNEYFSTSKIGSRNAHRLNNNCVYANIVIFIRFSFSFIRVYVSDVFGVGRLCL